MHAPRLRSIVIGLGGDVMTGRGIDQILPHPSSPEIFEPSAHDAREYVALAEAAHGPVRRPVDFEYVWGDALEELRNSELGARIVNLETSVTGNGAPWSAKGIHYRMHPDNVGCLTAARIDVCSLANNHVLDWGRPGLVETLATLHGAGLRTAGAGRTLAEAEEPALVDLHGGRAIVLGFGDHSSGIPDDWEATAYQSGTAPLDGGSGQRAEAVLSRIRSWKRRGDLTIVSLHWGPNWGYEVDEGHVRFAHRLIEHGADLVHGHSTHHPRPIEIHRGKLVLYGCGDLLNDYEGIAGYEAFRGDLVLLYLPRLDLDSGALVDLRMVPLRIRRMRLERAPRGDSAWLARRLSEISRPYGSRVARNAEGDLIATRA
jgi:poly-gamma-glutamate synthesis protein (capsule biosynthesis protein)